MIEKYGIDSSSRVEATTRKPEVIEHLQSLDDATKELEKAIYELEGRLEGVLRPIATLAEEPANPDPLAAAPLARELGKMSTRTRSSIDVIMAVLRRLEV